MRYTIYISQMNGTVSVMDGEAKAPFRCVAIFDRDMYGSQALSVAQDYCDKLNKYNNAERI